MRNLLLVVTLLVFLLSACNDSDGNQSAQSNDVAPTEVAAQPTDTPVPTAVPTDTLAPTSTPVPTQASTDTPVPPTDTPVPPTDTPVPPTDTPVPPTDTPVPTDPPPTDEPVSQNMIRIAVASANIRDAPDLEAQTVGVVYHNDVFDVEDEDRFGFWYQVTTNDGKRGWVAKSVTEPINSTQLTALEAELAPTPTPEPFSVRVYQPSATLRQGPGTEFDGTGLFVYHDEVYTVQEVSRFGYWYKVQLESGDEGWVAASVTVPTTGGTTASTSGSSSSASSSSSSSASSSGSSSSSSSSGSSSASSPPSLQPPAGAVRIMPLGDDLTSGTELFANSYRRQLWTFLTEDGYVFDFVGTRTTYSNPRDFDTDHEGHHSWLGETLIGQLPKYLPAQAPDVVLLHMGTTDLVAGQSVASTVGEVETVIELLRANNPNIKIVVARIMPVADPAVNARIAEFNVEINRVAWTNGQANSPIFVVDMFTGFDAATDTIDGIHANAAGADKMARQWFWALVANGLVGK